MLRLLTIPTRRSSDLLRQSASPGRMLVEISEAVSALPQIEIDRIDWEFGAAVSSAAGRDAAKAPRSEEHTSELQSLTNLVCRLLLEKKKNKKHNIHEL